MTKTIGTICALLAFGTACRRPPQQPVDPVVKYGVPVRGGPMDTLLVKDYAPASSLIVPRTQITKARFPAIDVHSHASMSQIKTRADVEEWLKTMDEAGLEMSVVFTGASGAEFDRMADLFLQADPKRFQVWYSPDPATLPSSAKRAEGLETPADTWRSAQRLPLLEEHIVDSRFHRRLGVQVACASMSTPHALVVRHQSRLPQTPGAPCLDRCHDRFRTCGR